MDHNMVFLLHFDQTKEAATAKNGPLLLAISIAYGSARVQYHEHCLMKGVQGFYKSH